MRLSKLKLAGFKTFVEPTTLLTPGQLVGIVGPNGCGKSNVIDAVRWVLGETRASALRGESMQDVIFNGSATRKPVSRASVELVFDNKEGRAAGQWSHYAEISVKRILDRSGESRYFINQTHVRRKDVIDLFLGTGLGPRAYAIIEQGMISRVIEARPEEIRAFLEEAAGVTKYRERRRETEGRLSDARDNLIRLNDICAELDERIVHLDVQAIEAERYQLLQKSQMEKQQLLWFLRRNEAYADYQQKQEALNRDTVQLEADNMHLQKLGDLVREAREQHLTASDQMHEAQSALFAATAEVSRLETELFHLAQTRMRVETRLAQLAQDETHWIEQEKKLVLEAARWKELDEQVTIRLEQTRLRYKEIKERLPVAEQAQKDAGAIVNTVRDQLAQSEQQIRVEETRRASVERALTALNERRVRLLAERQTIEGPDTRALDFARARRETLQVQFDDVQESLIQMQSQLPDAQATFESAQRDERKIEKEVSDLKARYQALVQLQQRVQKRGKLADWVEHHALSQWVPLWQYLHVKPGWEMAVEVALRERLGALFSEGDCSGAADFKQAVSRMLATPPPASLQLIALHAGVAGEEEKASADLQLQQQGAVPLNELVEVKSKESLQALLRWWCTGWYAVKNLQNWVAVHDQLAPDVRLVNPQGQVLSFEGIAHVVPDNHIQGVIERQREIDMLSLQLEKMKSQMQEACEVRQTLADVLSQLQNQIAELRREVQVTQGQLHAEEVALLKLEQANSRAIERQSQIERDLEDLVRQELNETAHLEQALREHSRIEALITLQREQLGAAMVVFDECEQTVSSVRALEQNCLRDMQEAQFSVRECAGKLEEIERNRTLAVTQLERLMLERTALEETRTESDAHRCQDELEKALFQRSQRETALTVCRDVLEQAAESVRQNEEARLRTEQEAVPVRERVAQLRLAVQAAELAMQQFEARLVEVEADEAILTTLLTADIQENSLQRELSRLNRALAELGPVNMAALEELKAARERKGYLDAQSADLQQAIDTLENAIRRIDRETREQLKDTYNTVSRHFASLFPRLFGGGRAELVLLGEEILDAGIQIVAQPPGKKNASIHLLSGGEKALTAIALVFAMFQLNPAPFCMLDEVDAPLDDANTERYGQMVKEMSDQTQFIFISHNKITMEIASQLVGVTMQEQGVSRVVEVDMDAALRLTETALV